MKKVLALLAAAIFLITFSIYLAKQDMLRVNQVDINCAVAIASALKDLESSNRGSIQKNWDTVECSYFPGKIRIYVYVDQKGRNLNDAILGGNVAFWFDSQSLELIETVAER